MDFKRIFQGGEPNICMPDLVYMPYSNYFAIKALAKNLDVNNAGIKITGVNISCSYDDVLRKAIVSLSNGFVTIDGELIKVDSTPSLEFDVEYLAPGATYYIFAKKYVSFNSLGTKVYNDNVIRETWEETRVTIVASKLSTQVPGTTLIGYISFIAGQSNITITPTLKDSFEQNIKKYNTPNITTVERDGYKYTIVSPDVLYGAIGNQTLLKLTSFAKAYYDNDFPMYSFNIPSTVKHLKFISCDATDYSNINMIYGSNGHYANQFEHYVYDKTNNILVVNFPYQHSIKPLSETATVLLSVNYVSETSI